MLAVEAQSGQTTWLQVSRPLVDPKNKVDTERLSVGAIGAFQTGTVYHRLMEDLIILVDSLSEANDFLSRKRMSASEQRAKQIENTSEMVAERLRFVRNKTQLMLPAIRLYKERALAQISATYNVIAEQDKEFMRQLGVDTRETTVATMKDSSAMKSISVVTMVFLPGTFLAVRNSSKSRYYFSDDVRC